MYELLRNMIRRLNRLQKDTHSFQIAVMAFFSEAPYIPIAEPTYNMWRNAVTSSGGPDDKALQDAILRVMRSVLHTPVVVDEEERTEAEVLTTRPAIPWSGSTTEHSTQGLEDVPNVHAAGVLQDLQPADLDSEPGQEDNISEVIDNPGVTEVQELHISEAAATQESATISEEQDGFINPIQEFDGRFIKRVPEQAEIITRALERQWSYEALKFQVYMHEISEDSPEVFIQGQSFEWLINRLVCFIVG